MVSKSWMNADAHNLDLLAAYVEDTLDRSERSAVAAHLSECRDCRAVLAEYVKAAIAEGHTPSRRRTWGGAPGPRVWLPIAATIAVATVASSVYITQRNNEAGPVAPSTHEGRPALPSEPVSRPDSPTVSPPASTVPPAAGVPTVPRQQPRVDDDLMRLRGAERRVGDKRFKLVSGEWIDTAYDPFGALPIVEARTPVDRVALLERLPALRPFAALGERVTVVYDGTIYKFGGSDLP
jgi:hypothetical protein